MARLQLAPIAAALLFGTASLAMAQSPTTADPSGDHSTSAGAETSSPLAPSETAIKTKLESAGYTQVRDIKSTAEGFSAKAVKQGNKVSLIIDSSGQIREKPAAE
jgi:Peptidase propeptide and YPEB domain